MPAGDAHGLTASDVWTIVGAAAGVATAVATAVSAFVAVLIRWRDRPGPDWACSGHWDWIQMHATGKSDEAPRLIGTVTNAGDGSAFRLTVRGDGCDAKLFRVLDRASSSGVTSVPESFTAVLQPGESRQLFARAVTREVYDSAAFVLAWTESPTRRGKRREQQLPFSLFADAPPDKPPKFNQQTGNYE